MTAATARRTDPASSHRAVTAIASDYTLAQNIMGAALRLNQCGQQAFDDTDLLCEIEDAIGRRQQRNVIARARGRMESESLFVRVGEQVNREKILTVHFRLPWEQGVLFDRSET